MMDTSASCTAVDYDGLAYLHKVAEMGGHMEDLLFLSCAFEGLEHEADVGNFNGPWSASFRLSRHFESSSLVRSEAGS